MLQNLTADDVKEPVAWDMVEKKNGLPLSVPLLDQERRRDLSRGGFRRGRKMVTVDAQTN
ncbi:unnamed protein product, partial [Brassica oleracea]